MERFFASLRITIGAAREREDSSSLRVAQNDIRGCGEREDSSPSAQNDRKRRGGKEKILRLRSLRSGRNDRKGLQREKKRFFVAALLRMTGRGCAGKEKILRLRSLRSGQE